MGFASGLNAGSSMIERGMKMRQIKEDREKQAKYEEALKEFETSQEALVPPKQSAAVNQGQDMNFAQRVGAGLDGTGAPVAPSASPKAGLAGQAVMPQQSPVSDAQPMQSPAAPQQAGLSGRPTAPQQNPAEASAMPGMAQVPQQAQQGPLEGADRFKAMRSIAMQNGNIEDAKYFDTQLMNMETQDLARKQHESLDQYRQWTMERTSKMDEYGISRDSRADRISTLDEIATAGATRAAAGEIPYSEALIAAREIAKTPEELARVDNNFYKALEQNEGVKPAEMREFQKRTMGPVRDFMDQNFENENDELAAAEQLLSTHFDSDVTDGIPVTIRRLENGGVAVMEGDVVKAQGASAKEVASKFLAQAEKDPMGHGIFAYNNNKKRLGMMQRQAEQALKFAEIDSDKRIEAAKLLSDLSDPSKNGGKILGPDEYRAKAAEIFETLNIKSDQFAPMNDGGLNPEVSTIIGGFQSRGDVEKMRAAIAHIDPDSPMGKIMHQAVNMGLKKFGEEEPTSDTGGLDPDPNRVPFGERLQNFFGDPEGADTRRMERRN